MTDGFPPDQALDTDRARLIGSIYEVVLRPEHFDSFMSDWGDYVDQAARRLGELHVTEGQASRHVDDPVIETHFRRALALFERMGRGAVVPLAPMAEDPLIRLDRTGSILHAGSEVAALFGADELSLETIRAALEPDSATRFTAFLTLLGRAPASGRFAVLSLAEASGGPRADLPGGGLLALVTARDPAGAGFVAELRPMAIGWTPALAGLLVESFRLTPRETELVRELARGGDLPAIAARTGRSLNTLRAQVKSVFAKTRTAGQSELMRLIAVLMLHGPDAGAGPNPEADAGAGADARAEINVDVGDGRSMPVTLLGPEDGLPVVFVHGMLEGHGALQGITPHLMREGLRLIAPERANFGRSYRDPRVREAPDVFARDLAAVLARLGVRRAITLGHMAGAVYAHTAAARLETTIAGMVGVAGCVPIKSIEQFATMTPRQRAMALTARFAPALLPAVLRAGIAQIDSRNAERFMTPLYAEGSQDRAVADRLGLVGRITDGYRYTVAQGQQAFRVDAWHVTRDWTALMATAEYPMRLIHGTLDPVVSFQSVQQFAQSWPRARLIEIEGEGQLLLYSQPHRVVAEVAAFARSCLLP
ncbi:MAG: alpha/beta hydrolase [Rhodobacter sp.]|uniref:alpha/beta hydrolase n=1 Tax=Pararhodobacter sp. TaxID=2127056 RepID=UPI001DBE27CF|nr:alpha/beta hydrolase [Pararhodobacter sp.]MCB1343718.1 alpha/beta hydrolase [Paracoccaceae bacterium]MCC0074511.1 alpha/beta hydrolase [Rhodobacter sp.]HPD91879.1 alpha/beta hydrolase [Pararhodobacter sp.]